MEGRDRDGVSKENGLYSRIILALSKNSKETGVYTMDLPLDNCFSFCLKSLGSGAGWVKWSYHIRDKKLSLHPHI